MQNLIPIKYSVSSTLIVKSPKEKPIKNAKEITDCLEGFNLKPEQYLVSKDKINGIRLFIAIDNKLTVVNFRHQTVYGSYPLARYYNQLTKTDVLEQISKALSQVNIPVIKVEDLIQKEDLSEI